jgi:hypothetical protein
MPLNKEQMREYMRKRREAKKGEKRELVKLKDKGVIRDVAVVEKWDKGKYPVRKAWEIAVARAERARKYALMFPHLIFKSDLVFQDVGWQYENEGLKAVAQ